MTVPGSVRLPGALLLSFACSVSTLAQSVPVRGYVQTVPLWSTSTSQTAENVSLFNRFRIAIAPTVGSVSFDVAYEHALTFRHRASLPGRTKPRASAFIPLAGLFLGAVGGPMTPAREVDYILDDCFLAVGQTVGTRKALDFEAVRWWRERYHVFFLSAMVRLGNSWGKDRDRVTAVGRFLGQRALHHAGDSLVIDLAAPAGPLPTWRAGAV